MITEEGDERGVDEPGFPNKTKNEQEAAVDGIRGKHYTRREKEKGNEPLPKACQCVNVNDLRYPRASFTFKPPQRSN